MEGNIWLDTRPPPPPSRSAQFAGCRTVLTRSNSGTSSLTAGNCEDVLRLADDCKAWTDEKHNLFLNRLEESFVSQLHQSKGIVEKCYGLKERGTSKSQKLVNDAHNSFRQFNVLRNGCWQNIKSERPEFLSDTSADSHSRLKSPYIYQFKRLRKDCYPPSADVGELFELSGTHEQRKEVQCHGMETYSQQCSTSSLYKVDSFDVTTAEGMGQNFPDEDNQSKSNIESRVKRFKRASASTTIPNQEPSNNKLFSC